MQLTSFILGIHLFVLFVERPMKLEYGFHKRKINFRIDGGEQPLNQALITCHRKSNAIWEALNLMRFRLKCTNDKRLADTRDDDLSQPPEPTMMIPLAQEPDGMTLLG